MRIQHNIASMNAYRNYNNNISSLNKNLEKLSSGYKINRAGDDAAGLAISEKMRAQISGLNAATKNVKDGISLVKTAEGAMQEVQDMLNRMDYLATQSANGTYDEEVDRMNLQKEVSALCEEIDRIADSSNFNGIQLMDGSLAKMGENSGVTSVTTEEYKAAGVNDTFKAEYITNRPEPTTKQTNAEFTISLDDLNFTSQVKAGDKFTLTIGDATLEYTVDTDGDVTSADDLAEKLFGSGVDGAGSDVVKFVSGGGVASADVDGKDTTAQWDAELGDNTTQEGDGSLTADSYLKIDGHWYEMSTSNNTITFKQVDYTGTSGETINADFDVKIKYEATTGNDTEMTGTVNKNVQQTINGTGIGAAHQAQVDVAVDFSKLKDKDELVIGGTSYIFKVGEKSTTAATDASVTGSKLIDLSSIFKTEEDLLDADKQAKAMAVITKAIDGGTNTNDQWSVGNGGVASGVGTLTFQSKSTYTDAANNIAGTTTKAKMDTESNIMAQFVSKSASRDAKVTLDFDVTKLKAGDLLTVNGQTFEFTDGARTSKAEYTAIDLSNYNIKDGIAAYDSDNVLNAVKTAVDGAFAADYTVTVDGTKLSLTSKDNSSTASVFENRTPASISFGGGSGLTLQIGDTAEEYNQLKVTIGDMHVDTLGVGDIDISTQEGASAAIDKIKAAINSVSSTRGDLGAIQNRLEHTQNNLSVMTENITDAESTIRDTDVAEEMMSYTANNILLQSAQAMLAQANSVPQGVLQLLG